MVDLLHLPVLAPGVPGMIAPVPILASNAGGPVFARLTGQPGAHAPDSDGTVPVQVGQVGVSAARWQGVDYTAVEYTVDGIAPPAPVVEQEPDQETRLPDRSPDIAAAEASDPTPTDPVQVILEHPAGATPEVQQEEPLLVAPVQNIEWPNHHDTPTIAAPEIMPQVAPATPSMASETAEKQAETGHVPGAVPVHTHVQPEPDVPQVETAPVLGVTRIAIPSATYGTTQVTDPEGSPPIAPARVRTQSSALPVDVSGRHAEPASIPKEQDGTAERLQPMRGSDGAAKVLSRQAAVPPFGREPHPDVDTVPDATGPVLPSTREAPSPVVVAAEAGPRSAISPHPLVRPQDEAHGQTAPVRKTSGEGALNAAVSDRSSTHRHQAHAVVSAPEGVVPPAPVPLAAGQSQADQTMTPRQWFASQTSALITPPPTERPGQVPVATDAQAPVPNARHGEPTKFVPSVASPAPVHPKEAATQPQIPSQIPSTAPPAPLFRAAVPSPTAVAGPEGTTFSRIATHSSAAPLSEVPDRTVDTVQRASAVFERSLAPTGLISPDPKAPPNHPSGALLSEEAMAQTPAPDLGLDPAVMADGDHALASPIGQPASGAGPAPAIVSQVGAGVSLAASAAAQIVSASLDPKAASGVPMEIALDPPELGRVRVGVTEAMGTLTLTITTERPETNDLMRRHLNLLAEELRQAGLGALEVNISQQGRREQRAAPERPIPPVGAGMIDQGAEPQNAARVPVASALADGALDLRL